MRILLFDIDGTLLLTDGGGKRAFERVFREVFSIHQPNINIPFSGRTDHSILSDLLEVNGLENNETNKTRLLNGYTECFPTVLGQCGGQVLPGVVELLEQLSRHPHLYIYVMTGNLLETATHKLQHFGLFGFFRGIFGGDFDPHRDQLARRTAQALREHHGDHDRHQVFVIGDTPNDIRCGHAIGASVIAVCTGRYGREELQSEQPAHVFDDFSKVDAICELLV